MPGFRLSAIIAATLLPAAAISLAYPLKSDFGDSSLVKQGWWARIVVVDGVFTILFDSRVGPWTHTLQLPNSRKVVCGIAQPFKRAIRRPKDYFRSIDHALRGVGFHATKAVVTDTNSTPPRQAPYRTMVAHLPAWLFACLVLLDRSMVLVVTVLRRLRHIRKGECLECGYDLRLNESGRCPECGTLVGTYNYEHADNRVLRTLASAATVFCLLSIFFCFTPTSTPTFGGGRVIGCFGTPPPARGPSYPRPRRSSQKRAVTPAS